MFGLLMVVLLWLSGLCADGFLDHQRATISAICDAYPLAQGRDVYVHEDGAVYCGPLTLPAFDIVTLSE